MWYFSKWLFGIVWDCLENYLTSYYVLRKLSQEQHSFHFEIIFFIRDQCDNILPGNAGIPSRLSVFSEAQERDRVHSRFQCWVGYSNLLNWLLIKGNLFSYLLPKWLRQFFNFSKVVPRSMLLLLFDSFVAVLCRIWVWMLLCPKVDEQVWTSESIICRNDLLSLMMSWVGCLLKDSELFILFAENSQILIKISVIPILLT